MGGQTLSKTCNPRLSHTSTTVTGTKNRGRIPRKSPPTGSRISRVMRMAVVITDFVLAGFSLWYRITQVHVWIFFITVFMFTMESPEKLKILAEILKNIWRK